MLLEVLLSLWNMLQIRTYQQMDSDDLLEMDSQIKKQLENVF